MAITQPRKVQIPKFWCLKSSTNIWPSFGNINSIPKVNKIEWEGKKGSKSAKIGQFFALKKLKLHFLKNFPRFDLTAFFCDFPHIRPIIFYWESSWYRITGQVWREGCTGGVRLLLRLTICCVPLERKFYFCLTNVSIAVFCICDFKTVSSFLKLENKTKRIKKQRTKRLCGMLS